MAEHPSDSDPESFENTDPLLAADEAKVALQRYWRKNLCIMAVLMVFWAVVSLGCGVLWADALNEYTLPGTGFPLGFWFAQQGSIIGFLFIILAYVVLMNRLDRRHHNELEQIRNASLGGEL